MKNGKRNFEYFEHMTALMEFINENASYIKIELPNKATVDIYQLPRKNVVEQINEIIERNKEIDNV